MNLLSRNKESNMSTHKQRRRLSGILAATAIVVSSMTSYAATVPQDEIVNSKITGGKISVIDAELADQVADIAEESAQLEDIQEESLEQESAQTVTPINEVIAAYAMQFVGNPYRWGGESLTHGTDCSGFVKSVYANFGIALPRNSAEQRSVGMPIGDLSQAIPGDIICYSGHVGLYIGNGLIVNALSRRAGITVTDAAFKKILSIRRVV
jgi:cell wall-associated NlpC family hydrolase